MVVASEYFWDIHDEVVARGVELFDPSKFTEEERRQRPVKDNLSVYIGMRLKFKTMNMRWRDQWRRKSRNFTDLRGEESDDEASDREPGYLSGMSVDPRETDDQLRAKSIIDEVDPFLDWAAKKYRSRKNGAQRVAIYSDLIRKHWMADLESIESIGKRWKMSPQSVRKNYEEKLREDFVGYLRRNGQLEK